MDKEPISLMLFTNKYSESAIPVDPSEQFKCARIVKNKKTGRKHLCGRLLGIGHLEPGSVIQFWCRDCKKNYTFKGA